MKRSLYRVINFWSYLIMIFIIFYLFAKDIRSMGFMDWATNGENEEYQKSIQDRVSEIYPEKIGLIFSIVLWGTFINLVLL